MTTITTLTTTTAQRAAGAPTPAGTPPTTDPAAANTDVFGPAVKVDLSDEVLGYATSLGSLEPLVSLEKVREVAELARKLSVQSALSSAVLSPASAELSRIVEARSQEAAATGADVIGEIVKDGKTLVSIGTIGGFGVERLEGGQELASLGFAVSQYGLFKPGPLDTSAIQAALDRFGPGLSFIDRRTPQALELRDKLVSGKLFPSFNSLVPKLTPELLDQIAVSSSELASVRSRITDADISEFNARYGK